MRRKLLYGALTLLGLILLSTIALFWFIRSGRLDIYIQRQIVLGLRDVGVNAEIGGTYLDIRGYKVTLNDVSLSAIADNRPIGIIGEIVVEFSVVEYLKQKIDITKVNIRRPEIWIELDEQGRSNLDTLHAPPEKADTEERAINFLTANATIEQGIINLVDRKNKVSARLPDLYANLIPRTEEAIKDRINHKLELRFNQGTAEYEGRKIENINSLLDAYVVQRDASTYDATMTSFQLVADPGEIKASGTISSADGGRYEFKGIESNVSLDQVSRIFMPDRQMGGKVSLRADLRGTGMDYQAQNIEVRSDSLAAEGFRVSNLLVQAAATGKGAEYDATATVSSGPVTGPDLQLSSMRVSDASVRGKGGAFDVSDDLALGMLRSGPLTIGGLRGKLFATPDRAGLSGFTASLLGGTVSGSASIGYSGGPSNVDAQFRSIDLNQAAEAAAARDVTVRGTANGTARLSFPGLNYEAATGRADITFDASVSAPQSTAESAPAKGELTLIATGRGVNIQRARIVSANSEITASGSVGWRGAAALDVNFRSEDMAEVQRVVDAFGFIPAEIKEQYEISLAGRGAFTGRVQGSVSAPNVSGHLSLENIQAHNETLGSFEGDIGYAPSLVRVENGAVVRPDGSRADFNLNAPLAGENRIAVKASVQNFDLPALVRVASPGLADFIGSGAISGDIDLRGLPGPRTIEGTANLTLKAGEFNIPAAEEGQDSRKISVPEFAGGITFQNSTLSVNDLRLQVGDSTITGQGSFNLDTYAYSINAEGRNIDLAQVSQAATDSALLTGRADLTVTGKGEWENWTGINLNATLQGQNVALNGRSLGDAKVVAFTQDGQLRVEATGDVLDQQRTLAATIDLRDRKNYPVSASIEFNDTDLGPYLGLISPDLSTVSGRATGSIKLSGPLLDTDRLQAVANIVKLELGGTIAGGQNYSVSNVGPIVVTASPKEITLDSVTFVGEGTSVTLGGNISRGENARSNLTVSGEVNLRLVSSFVESVFVTGIAGVEASITGSLDSPRLLGSVSLRDVGVRVVDLPLSLARGNGIIRFTANQALIENFVASTPGGGTITLTGGAALSGLAPQQWRIGVEADQVGMEYPQDTQTVFDASLALQGNPSVQVLSGEVDVRRAAYTKDITIEELVTTGGPFGSEFLEAGPGGGGGVGAGPRVTLDLRVSADNTLVVRNNLVDAVGSAFINLRGPVSDPITSGRVQISRGTLEFRGGRHEITRGIVTLPGRRRADPILDVQSEAEISGYRVIIAFSGPLNKMQTTLRSDPELPERDVVSLVLTGSVSGDRGSEAALTQTGLGLAQSLLAAGISEQLQRGTQRLFGLSRFSLDPLIVGRGSDPTARVTLGQRITKNLTITYSQNLTSGPSGIDRIVLVEYRLTNRFSVVGFRNDRGELGFDVRVRKRF